VPIPALLVIPAWVIFWVVWLAGAFGNARTVRSAPGWDRLLLALAVVLGILAWRGGLAGPPLRSATIDEPRSSRRWASRSSTRASPSRCGHASRWDASGRAW
jgi:hypothetical protein